MSAMLMDEVESAKQKYTDQYVAIASRRPELMRFAGLVGQVKTVNMSGRALVQWVHYFDNVGWYDIDLRDLMIVPKPAEPEVVKPAAAKTNDDQPSEAEAKPKAKISPLELLRQQAAAKKDTAAPVPAETPPAKLSPIELLRQQAAAKKAVSEEASTAESTAAPESTPAKKLSPIEILRQQAAAKKAAEEGDAK
ncbi:hypothetical protein [Aeoliella sp. SH292]|uniref:hypothetical protein n=1 Tax=Aeoliella sp. SH292 TaxID=3454464 RepID=UPI003F9999D7